MNVKPGIASANFSLALFTLHQLSAKCQYFSTNFLASLWCEWWLKPFSCTIHCAMPIFQCAMPHFAGIFGVEMALVDAKDPRVSLAENRWAITRTLNKWQVLALTYREQYFCGAAMPPANDANNIHVLHMKGKYLALRGCGTNGQSVLMRTQCTSNNMCIEIFKYYNVLCRDSICGGDITCWYDPQTVECCHLAHLKDCGMLSFSTPERLWNVVLQQTWLNPCCCFTFYCT